MSSRESKTEVAGARGGRKRRAGQNSEAQHSASLQAHSAGRAHAGLEAPRVIAVALRRNKEQHEKTSQLKRNEEKNKHRG
jgi:hypothetical protein